MRNVSMTIIAALTLSWAACSSEGTPERDSRVADGGGVVDNGPVGETGSGGLAIEITSPTAGATDVSVTAPALKASFSKALKDANELEVLLLKDGAAFHGLKKYSATNLEVIFEPFNLLQSRAEYTFTVKAEGAEASTTFTTEQANEGPLPPVADQTYDFRIKEITYPGDLAAVFNSQLVNAPPVLLHVVWVKDEGDQDGNAHGSLLIAGSTGKVGDEPGKSAVLPEDAEHTATTSTEIAGRLEGNWFGAGPADLHTTASGVALVIRDFYVTGLFGDDAEASDIILTGLIDPVELGEGLDIDLSFLCDDNRFSKYCDEEKRMRVTATIEATLNPIPFTAFVTAPVNASDGVDPATAISVYFSEPADQAATKATLTDATGAPVAGSLTFDGDKAATFKPAAPLAAATEYVFEVAAVASGTPAADTRHARFTTK